jgi:nucleoid-associated protein YgaU
MYPQIEIRQPQPNDIVGSRVYVTGLGTGFESEVQARVRDGDGRQLGATSTMCGGELGQIGQFQMAIDLPEELETPAGFVEVYDENTGFPGEGPYDGGVADLHKVVVPVVFGSHLLEGYRGFTYHVVLHGESLSKVAADVYGVASVWRIIYEANRDQIGDPNLIFSGQRFRIPRT